MEQNLQRLRVGSQDDDLRDTAVEGLGGCSARGLGAITLSDRQQHTFVSTLLQLLELGSPLYHIQDLRCVWSSVESR